MFLFNIIKILNNSKVRKILVIIFVSLMLFSSRGYVMKYRGVRGVKKIVTKTKKSITDVLDKYEKVNKYNQEKILKDQNNEISNQEDSFPSKAECGKFAVVEITLKENESKSIIRRGFIGKDLSRVITIFINNKEVGFTSDIEAPEYLIGLYDSNEENNNLTAKYKITLLSIGNTSPDFFTNPESFSCHRRR